MSDVFSVNKDFVSDVSECIDRIEFVLERGLFAINELTNGYSFNDRPEIINGWLNDSAAKVYIEYGRIEKLMWIASDYIWEATQIIKRASELDAKRRAAEREQEKVDVGA